VKSGRGLFLAPHVGYARRTKAGNAYGIALYGNGGMNTSYPASAGGGAGTFYGGSTGINLEQLFVAPTYAGKWNAKSAWGISPIFVYQRFEAKGLSNFGSMVADGTPDNLTNRGVSTSTGFGVRLGLQTSATPKLTLGAAYQPKIKMSRFDKYSDLFAQRGRFDIPANGSVGLAYKTGPDAVVAFDIQEILYSKVASVGNPFSNLAKGLAGDPSYLLGADNGPGFGWRDETVYKLGYQWVAAPGWTTRAGISYGRQPIPDSQTLFNILAPGVEEWHFAAGVSHSTGKDSEWTVAATFAPSKTVTGPNPLEVTGQQTISLKMRQLDFEANWAKHL
jgi:long-chain fatty acid transport protein